MANSDPKHVTLPTWEEYLYMARVSCGRRQMHEGVPENSEKTMTKESVPVPGDGEMRFFRLISTARLFVE